MSRHVFDQGNIRTVVGWDQALQTFFVHQGAINPATSNWMNEDHGPETWLGATFQSIPTISELVKVDWDYQIGLSPDTFELLEKDQKFNV